MSIKYEIYAHENSSDSYFFSNTSYTYDLISVHDKLIIESYYGKWFESTGGCTKEGVENAILVNPTKLKLINFDKTTRDIDLPIKLEFINDPAKNKYPEYAEYVKLYYQNGETKDQLCFKTR